MDRNPLVWAFMLLQIGGIVCIVVWMWWMGRVFSCPDCAAQVSRRFITKQGIECPKCGWRVTSVTEREVDTTSSAVTALPDCPLCQQPPVDEVHLFDGKVYCFECLCRVSPALAQYARTHDTLEETQPRSLSLALWSGFCVTVLITSAMVIVVIMWWIVTGNGAHIPWLKLAEMAGFSFAFIGVVAFPFMVLWYFCFAPRTIRIAGGKVWLKPPGDQVWRLDEIYWSETSTRCDLVNGAALPWRTALIIFTHEGARHGMWVGRNSETADVWRDFLRFSAAKVHPKWPRRTARLQ